MTEEQKIAAAAEVSARQKKIELFFDYTKFHIGLYLTLTASYVTVATAKVGDQPLLILAPPFLWFAVIAFMIAGLAGGVIASSVTQTQMCSVQEFLEEPTGLWNWKRTHFRARIWTYIEHTAFWLGILSAVLSFVFRR